MAWKVALEDHTDEGNAMKSHRRLGLLLIGLAVAMNACSQRQVDFSGQTTFKMHRDNDSDIVTLKVPNGYLDGFVMYGPPVPGAKDSENQISETLYLQAALPDFGPRSTENNWKFEFPGELTQNIKFYLFSMHRRHGKERQTAIQNIIRGSIIAPNGCKYEKRSGRHGLESIFVDFNNCANHSQMSLVRDYFYKVNEFGEYVTMVECSAEEFPVNTSPISVRAINPICEHAFYDSKYNVIYKARYPRPLLSDWENIELKVRTMVRSFIAD